jgi:hypothetical protein
MSRLRTLSVTPFIQSRQKFLQAPQTVQRKQPQEDVSVVDVVSFLDHDQGALQEKVLQSSQCHTYFRDIADNHLYESDTETLGVIHLCVVFGPKLSIFFY